MRQHQETLRLRASRQGLHPITRELEEVVARADMETGIATVLVRHTSASLLIQENADPSARHDLETWFARLAPEGDPRYTHTAEGPDDMPAHLRAAVTRSSEQIPIRRGRLALGTWQGLYLFEHRSTCPTREIVVHVLGE